jgi:hypothetical protein
MSVLSLTLSANRSVRYWAPIRLLRRLIRRVSARIARRRRAIALKRLNDRTESQTVRGAMHGAAVARAVAQKRVL